MSEKTKQELDRLEGRIAYAKSLRKKSKEANKLAVWLNDRLQNPNVYGFIGKQPVTITRTRWSRLWMIYFGKHQLALTEEQMEQIFTWSMDSSQKLLANAERIEAELTGTNND
jgi:hypothetical protein